LTFDRRIRRLLFLAALAGYTVLLLGHTSFAVGGSDSSGYANTARMILSGRLVQRVQTLDQLELPDHFARVFMPLAHEPGPRPRTMVPLYPPGFPLHVAALASLFGWSKAPFLLSPLAGALLLLLTYLLAREMGLGPLAAFLAAVILGGSAVLLYNAVQPISDVVAAAWVAGALLLALRSHRGSAWSLAAGAAFGAAVLVRPTNALAILPLLIAIGLRPRALGSFALGGLPFGVYQAWWNATLFGNPVSSGYGGVEGFRLENFPPRLLHYVWSLVQMFSVLIPAGWLAVLGDRRVPVRRRAILVSWFAPYLLLYCFWGPYEAWWYTRFFLPALPALCIAAVMVGRDLLGLLRSRLTVWPSSLAAAAAVLLLAVVGVCEGRSIRRWDPLQIAEGEEVYPLATAFAQTVLPSNALVVSEQFSGAFRFYTGFQPVRWDWVEPPEFKMIRARAESKGFRWYAMLSPWEIDEAFRRAPGHWKPIGQVRDVVLFELD